MKLLSTLTAILVIQTLSLSDTIYVPDDYPTIQGTIDAAVNGDEIIVRPGTYVEKIDFVGKAITVMSKQGAAVTTIDGNHTGGEYCKIREWRGRRLHLRRLHLNECFLHSWWRRDLLPGLLTDRHQQYHLGELGRRRYFSSPSSSWCSDLPGTSCSP